MAEDIISLGFAFESRDADKEIKRLTGLLDDLSVKGSDVTKLFESISKISPIDESAVKSLSSFSRVLNSLKPVDSSISKGIQDIAESLTSVKAGDSHAITQISALSSAVKEFGKAHSGAQNIRDVSDAVSSIKTAPSGAIANIAQFADSMNKIKVGADSIQQLKDLSQTISAIAPVSPDVTESIKRFVVSMNTIQPINPDIVTGFTKLFSTVNAISINSDTGVSVENLAKAIQGLKAIKPEIAVSINDLFRSFGEAKTIPQDIIESILKLSEATIKFKAINPKVTSSVIGLNDAMRNLPVIDSGKTQSILNLAEATAKFKVINPKVVDSVKNLFKSLESAKRIPADISESLTRLSEALRGFRGITKKNVDNVRQFFSVLSSIRPVDGNVLSSLQSLAQAFTAIGRTNPASSIAQIGKTSSGMRQAADSANALTTGIMRLGSTGMAYSVFRNATTEAIRFGVELAHINSLSLEFDMSRIKTGLLNISSEYGSAIKNANAMYYAYSSGVRGTEQDLVNFTQDAAKLATVIRAGVTPTVDAMTSMMNAYNISAQESTKVTDIFYGIVKQGKASGQQLAASMGQVVSTAATAGVSVEELGASIASLTKVMSTRNAITYFNNMLSKILKPTKETTLAARNLGIELGLDALKAKGFAGMMQEIHDKTKGSQQAILSIFPDLRGQRAALQLLNKGWEDFQYQLRYFENAEGVAEEAMKKLTDNINFQISQIPATLEKLKIATGDVIKDTLTLNGALSPAIASFNRMSETTQKILGSSVALAMAYTVLKGATTLRTALQAMEIRNNETIAAQNARNAAVMKIDTEARRAGNILMSKRATLLAAETKAVLATTMALQKKTAIEITDIAYSKKVLQIEIAGVKAGRNSAIAINDVSAARVLNQKLIQKQIALQAIELKQSKLLAQQKIAEAAALTATGNLNSIYSSSKSSGIFSLLASGKGFWGGMGRSGIQSLKAFKYTGTGLGGMKSLTSMFPAITTGAKALGTALGSLCKTLLAIFSPLNIIIAGTAAVIAGIVDYARAGWDVNKTVLIKPIGEKLYNFFTGAIDEAKRLSGILDEARNLRTQIRDMKTAKIDMIRPFVNLIPKEDNLANPFAEYQKKLAKYAKALQGSDFKNTVQQYNSAIKELEEGQKLIQSRGNIRVDSKNYIGLINHLYEENYFSVQKRDEYIKKMQGLKPSQTQNVWGSFFEELSKTYGTEWLTKDTNQYFKNIENAIDSQIAEFQKHKAEIEKKSNDAKSKLDSALRPISQYFSQLKLFYEKQKTVYDSLSGVIGNAKFSMMDPEEQMWSNKDKVISQRVAYYHAIAKMDTDGAKKAFESMLQAHRDVISYYDKQIRENQTIASNADKKSFEYTLQRFPSDQSHILKQEAKRLMVGKGGLDSMFFGNIENMLQSGALPNLNLNSWANYDSAMKGMDMYIRAMQIEIQQKQKLADSERQANANTVNLIRSMDKFTQKSSNAVNALSIESEKLQSRSFDKLPNFRPSTAAQNSLSASNTQLSNMYKIAAAVATAFKQKAIDNSMYYDKQRDSQNQGLEKDLANYDKRRNEIAEELKKIPENMNQMAKNIADSLGIKDYKTILEKIATGVSGITSESYD